MNACSNVKTCHHLRQISHHSILTEEKEREEKRVTCQCEKESKYNKKERKKE